MVIKLDKDNLAIYESIDKHKNYILQGGAGSGKTETLKQTVEYILNNHPNKKVLCITHTNLAVEEIKSRVNGDFTVSTIHAFLNKLIKNYKKNIKAEMLELFTVSEMKYVTEAESEFEGNEYKKKRHEKYKKIYEECGTLSYRLLNTAFEKVPGKREFDKHYQLDEEGNIKSNSLENELNKNIQIINQKIIKDINSKTSNIVHYTNNEFNDREGLGYGHNGLIELSVKLIEKYSILQKVIKDMFDYILIDEYQDTNPNIIRVFLEHFSSDKNTVGLYGDSMQTIYDEGIGDVDLYIKKGILQEIIKEDNFRSSYPVVDFINNIRRDSLKQQVAFKKKSSGETEIHSDRQGKVLFYYVHSDNGINPIESLIEFILKDKKEYDVLMLTNRLIATELGFENLYSIFSDRGLDPINRMEENLTTLLLKELYEIIDAFNNNNYNFVIEKLKSNGWVLRKMKDKHDMNVVLKELALNKWSVKETLDFAFYNKLLKRTDQYKNYIYTKDLFLRDIERDDSVREFEKKYNDGYNTYTRINNKFPGLYSEYSFKELESTINKKAFYEKLFSEKAKFEEVMNYFDYILKDGKRKTMHKTKGSGLQNVAVVLDNFGWNKYNFSTLFTEIGSGKVRKNSLNLFYVACSRAIENLIIMKFIESEEELKKLKEKFSSKKEQIEFKEIKLEEIEINR